eukprot:7303474-Pyramimonas_sp.AAC.1
MRENITAAQNYVTACIQMGSPWCKWDNMSKRVKYLYMTETHREEMEMCWEEHTKLFPADQEWMGEGRGGATQRVCQGCSPGCPITSP